MGGLGSWQDVPIKIIQIYLEIIHFKMTKRTESQAILGIFGVLGHKLWEIMDGNLLKLYLFEAIDAFSISRGDFNRLFPLILQN